MKKSQETKEATNSYKKPVMLAKNAPAGGYAAGCPSKNSYQCKTCFRQ